MSACVQHGRGETCRFFTMKRDRTSDLPFAIFVRDTFRQALLSTSNPVNVNSNSPRIEKRR
jgi:hypothetical protein